MAVGWQIGVSLSTQVDFSCSFPEQLNSSGDLQAVEEGEEGRRREEGEEVFLVDVESPGYSVDQLLSVSLFSSPYLLVLV